MIEHRKSHVQIGNDHYERIEHCLDGSPMSSTWEVSKRPERSRRGNRHLQKLAFLAGVTSIVSTALAFVR